ncbi:MAG: transcriptional repressor, CopY family [Acidobacteria bacterium]|nr:transcriptional repressor, CopY family [Acidobacteriota bacterium]
MKRFTCLTPGEFELMEILWPMGEASVRTVWEKVGSSRSLAYTTVMTVLEKMYRKGILKQRKKGKAYLYSPTLSREEALKGVLEHICEIYFRGSRREMARFIKDQYPDRESSQSATPASDAQKATP